MKKFTFVFILLAILFSGNTFGQNTCSYAVGIDSIFGIQQKDTIISISSSNVCWINFTADTNIRNLSFYRGINNTALISNITLYHGNCNSLIVDSIYICNDTVYGVLFNNLNIGNMYYIKINFNNTITSNLKIRGNDKDPGGQILGIVGYVDNTSISNSVNYNSPTNLFHVCLASYFHIAPILPIDFFNPSNAGNDNYYYAVIIYDVNGIIINSYHQYLLDQQIYLLSYYQDKINTSGTYYVDIVLWPVGFGNPSWQVNEPVSQFVSNYYTLTSFYPTYLITIIVDAAAALPFQTQQDIQFTNTCTGSPTNFIGITGFPTTLSLNSITWDFGDVGSTTNTSTIQNPTHTYLNPGTYNVTFTFTAGNYCNSPFTTTKSVTIYQTPSQPIVNNTALCNGTFSLLITNAVSGATFAWSGGLTGNPAITSNTASYTVTQSLNGCTSTAGTIISSSTPATYTIQNNTETWTSSDHSVIHNYIVIPNGKTLQITSGVHQFTTNSNITVEAGGKLIVNNATLTNYCTGYTWQGIEVLGNSSLPQNSTINSSQGIVDLENGAIIENAEEAIRVWHLNDFTYASTGGIVIANNATFLNNRLSVEFQKYQNTIQGITKIGNLSCFNNCTFTVDVNYQSSNDFYCHVLLYNVNGIYFSGCTFLNNQSNKHYSLTNNKAIYSMDAGYTVNGFCTAQYLQYGQSCPSQYLNLSSFSGFNIAIHTTGSASSNVVNVENSTFDKNVRGVEFDAQNFSCVDKSNFSIGNSDIISSPYYHEGIFTNKLTSFRIEENTLQPSLKPATANIGIRVYNSLDANNQIYKNTATSLTIGEDAEGQNKDLINNIFTVLKGLKIVCNTNISNISAITITPSPNMSVNGICPYQEGNPVSLISPISAGNTFINNVSDITNNTTFAINYFYSSATNEQPLVYTLNYVIPTPTTNTNACQSNFTNGYSFPLSLDISTALENDYTLKETEYFNLLYNYNSLIDGGDKNTLLNHIESTWSQDAWSIRADLLAQSPYLSQDILRSFAIDNVLPQAMFLEICLANPDATRDEGFIDFLANEIPNPLPQYMLDLIVDNWDTKTTRTALEGSLSDLSTQMAFNSNLLITNSMLDSIQNKAYAQTWLLRRGNLSDYYSIAEFYVENNDFVSAMNYINQIPNLFNFSDEQNAEHSNFSDYITFRSTIATREESIMRLDSTEIITLQQIANTTNGRSSILAQNILCFGYQLCKDYLPCDSNSEHQKMSKPAKTAKQIFNSAYNKITASPNPAKTYVVFNWQLPLLNTNANLHITDVNGKIVEQRTISTKIGQWVWDTRKLNNGVYIYEIKSINQSLGSGKIIINN